MPNSPQKSDITTLITAFSTASGFQKSNRFRISITPPKTIPGGSQITPTVFTVFASNIQTPSQSIIFYEDTMSPSGPPISIPIRRNYDDRYIIEFIIGSRSNGQGKVIGIDSIRNINYEGGSCFLFPFIIFKLNGFIIKRCFSARKNE